MAAAHHQVHFATVRELDLGSFHHPNISDRINSVPAIKTSAAFFTFLRANLVLNPSAMSNPNTPQLEPWLPQVTDSLPAVTTTTSTSASTSSAASPHAVPLDDIPPLYLEPLTHKDDKVDALRLIADSVAQMSQHTSRTLVSHPICLAMLAAALAAVHQFSYASAGSKHRDHGTAIVLACGAIATYLLAIRYLASGYLTQAENIGWSWLRRDGNPDQEDILIGARFGGKIIGALVLRLEPVVGAPSSGNGGKRRNKGSFSSRTGQGVIRAWTTELQHRGQGVGRDLLHEAVRVTKERCGKDADVGFAQEHVNSQMVLPEMFNKTFRQQENRATLALHDVLGQWKKRRY
jgi:hypothetical protein